MADTQAARTRGLYFEEFTVGDAIRSASRTITETDVVNFAGLTGDWNQLHTDAEFAAETPYKARIAHGALGLSIATGLVTRLGVVEGTAIAFRSIEEWKFSRPIFIGDTIHVEGRVTETRPVARLGGGQVTFELAVVNQKGETCQRGVWVMLVRSGASES